MSRVAVVRTRSMLEASKLARWMGMEGIPTEIISVEPVRGMWGVVVPGRYARAAKTALSRAIRNRSRRKNPRYAAKLGYEAKRQLRALRNSMLPPSMKFSAVKRVINKYLDDLGKQHHSEIPIRDMIEFMEIHGVVPLDEDGTPLEGVILTGRQGQATFPLSYHGKPIKASWMLSWYKFDTGRYEIVSYVG